MSEKLLPLIIPGWGGKQAPVSFSNYGWLGSHCRLEREWVGGGQREQEGSEGVDGGAWMPGPEPGDIQGASWEGRAGSQF